MSPLDTELRSTTPAELPDLDHHELQRRGRRRRVATRAAAGSAGTAVVAAAVVVAAGVTGPAPIAPVAPPTGPAVSASSAPGASESGEPSIDRLRNAMESGTPADLNVTQQRDLRVVSAPVRAGRDVEEWASIAVRDQRAEDGQVTMTYTNTALRPGTTTSDLSEVLADIASDPDPLAQADAQGRWQPPGPTEPTTGGFEGDQQLDDAAAAIRNDDTIAAAQRLGDAMLSLSSGPEGGYWREVLDVLDQLESEQVTREVDLLGRDVTAFAFTADAERLQLNFDPTTGRPVGIDMLVDTHETDGDGTPLLQREVVVIP